MAASHAQKRQTRYRYYLARATLDGGPAAPSVRRIAAPAIEAAVLASLCQASRAGVSMTDAEVVSANLKQVTLHDDRFQLELVGQDEMISVAWSPGATQRSRDIIAPPGQAGGKLRPMKVADRARILRAIVEARGWMWDLTDGRIDGTDAIALREALTERSVRMILSLAQLAPSIVKAIVDGRLPRGIGIRDLVDLPASWMLQERALGIV